MPTKAKTKSTTKRTAHKPGRKSKTAARKSAPKAKSVARQSVSKAKPAARKKTAKRVRLLSGGNPQIAMADGNAPVKAYIAALPAWKRKLAKRIDAVIVRALPNVQQAVKWNSPLYGIEGKGFFLGVHTFTNYLKLAFFQGASLKPIPPGTSKDKYTRYLDVHEDDELDEAQLAKWVKQAAKLPGFLAPRTGS